MSQTTVMRNCLEELTRKRNIDVDVDSVFDEFAFDYIAEVLKESNDLDGSFDVDGFTALLAGYLPELEKLGREDVLSWIVATSDRVVTVGKSSSSSAESQELLRSNTLPPQSEGEPTSAGTVCFSDHKTGKGVEAVKRQSCSTAKTDCSVATATGSELRKSETFQLTDDERLLTEMFPDVPSGTVHRLYASESCCIDRTVERLIAAGEDMSRGVGESLTDCPKEEEELSTETISEEQSCDSQVKAAIISRYSFVDVDSDKTVHRPILLHKEESKKTRYRDGQVVSTKGERFTVLSKKDQESQEMKQTYINLKPLRHYRFH